jgi:hypothetical protein
MADQDEIPELHTTPAHVHEGSDVSIKGLGVFLAGLAITMILTGAIMVWLFNIFLAEAREADPTPSPLATPGEPAPPPGPLLQVAERLDLRVHRESQEKLIHETGWIDREAGVVRIPIDRAIELTAERGFPDWPPVAQGVASPAAAGENEAQQ